MPKRKTSASSVAPGSWEDEGTETWETYAPSDEPAREEDEGSNADDLADAEWEEATPADAEEELLSHILENQRRGHLSAKTICVISYWAGKAGLDTVGTLAVRPDSSTGNFQRKVDQVRRAREGECPGGYVVAIPAAIRASYERGIHDLVCIPPHEALVNEMRGNVGVELAAWGRVPNYLSHPVATAMRAPGTPVLPIALYLDGVQYGVNHSMLVVTMTNPMTLKKHVLCVLCKHIMCGSKTNCGSSLYPFWQFLRWSLKALSCATFPTCRHHEELDGDKLKEGWRPEDRRNIAGEPMPFAAACLQLRADWGE